MLRLHKNTVRRMVRDGRLPAVLVTNKYLIPWEAISKLLGEEV